MTFERQRQRQRQSDLDSIRNSCDVYKDLCTWITLIGYSTRSPSPENWSQKAPSSSSPPSKSSPPGHWAIPSHLTKHCFITFAFFYLMCIWCTSTSKFSIPLTKKNTCLSVWAGKLVPWACTCWSLSARWKGRC